MTGPLQSADELAGRSVLTIVVVTYNSAAYVRRCVQSLIDHGPRCLHKIIVVDNASSDDTVAILKTEFPGIGLLELPQNVGFGRGNNIGINKVPADFYYLHNADAYLQEGTLDDALNAMRNHPRLGIAGLPLVYPDHSPQTAAYAASTPRKWMLQATGLVPLARKVIQRRPNGLLARVVGRSSLGRSFATTYKAGGVVTARDSGPVGVTPFDWVCGAAMIIRDDALEALEGGFDPAIFIYGEDEDICLRARAAGWDVAQIQTRPVIHEFGWGKSVKTTQAVVDHKYHGLSVMIDRHFRSKPVKRATMRALLKLKHIGWSLSAKRG